MSRRKHQNISSPRPLVRPKAPDTPMNRLERQFRLFDSKNPQVYQTLVRLCREARAAGNRQIGIGMLWEVLRWKSLVETTGKPWKLNNNHRSRYARLIMAQEPDLDGIFEIRDLHDTGHTL